MDAVDIRMDNNGAISLSKAFNSSAAAKHIDDAYHSSRDYVEKGLVKFSYVSSQKIVADSMTKALGRIKLIRNSGMGRLSDGLN